MECAHSVKKVAIFGQKNSNYITATSTEVSLLSDKKAKIYFLKKIISFINAQIIYYKFYI